MLIAMNAKESVGQSTWSKIFLHFSHKQQDKIFKF